MSFRHRHPTQTVLTATGQLLRLRSIRPRDAQALVRGFSRLSPDEVRMRFLYPMKALTDELALRLSKLHRHREIALVLTTSAPAGDAPVYAVVRASREPRSSIADFAIVVPRALSNQGIGMIMMRALIDRCRSAGVSQIRGDVLHENAAMLALGKKLGFSFSHHAHEGGVLQMTLELASAT
jgi:acetyltransferase